MNKLFGFWFSLSTLGTEKNMSPYSFQKRVVINQLNLFSLAVSLLWILYGLLADGASVNRSFFAGMGFITLNIALIAGMFFKRFSLVASVLQYAYAPLVFLLAISNNQLALLYYHFAILLLVCGLISSHRRLLLIFAYNLFWFSAGNIYLQQQQQSMTVQELLMVMAVVVLAGALLYFIQQQPWQQLLVSNNGESFNNSKNAASNRLTDADQQNKKNAGAGLDAAFLETPAPEPYIRLEHLEDIALVKAQPPLRQPLHISHLAIAVSKFYETAAAKKDVRFTVHTQKKLVAAADVNMMELVLGILISHALNCAEQHSEIRIETAGDSRDVSITIEAAAACTQATDMLQTGVVAAIDWPSEKENSLLQCAQLIEKMKGALNIVFTTERKTRAEIKLPRYHEANVA